MASAALNASSSLSFRALTSLILTRTESGAAQNSPNRPESHRDSTELAYRNHPPPETSLPLSPSPASGLCSRWLRWLVYPLILGLAVCVDSPLPPTGVKRIGVPPGGSSLVHAPCLRY